MCENYEYFYTAVVGQYFKANCEVITVTTETLELQKKKP